MDVRAASRGSSRNSCSFILADSFPPSFERALICHFAENGNSALSGALRGDTTYGEKALPQKIFVQERLVNLLLASGQWNSRAYNIFDLNGSTTPLNQFYEQAVSANALKLAYSQTGNPIYRNAFLKLQKQVWEQSNIGVIGRCANPHDRLSA